MRVTVVRPDDLGSAESALWWSFQQSTPGGLSPFLSLTYARAVGRSRDSARVAVIEDGGQITAFLPYEQIAHRMGMPIGFPMNNLQGFIGADLPPGKTAREVIKRAGLRGWRFDAVRADQSRLKPFHYAGTAVQCPVIDLTKDLTHISTRKKARKALQQEHGAVEFEWHAADPAQLDRLIDWKSRKYHGSLLLFEDQTARAIVTELAESKNDDCGGVLSVLWAGQRPVTVHLGLRGPSTMAGWFMAHDPELSRFAPGLMLWHPLAAAARDHEIQQIDLGAGQDAYKAGLANGDYPVAGGAVWVSRAEAAGRQAFRRIQSYREHREHRHESGAKS